MDLFATTCLAHEGDAAGLRTALAARHIAPMPKDRAGALLVQPGEVFPVALPAQHMAVLSFDDGLCGTVAEDVDPGALLMALAASMKARGITVSTMGAAPEGRAQAYRLEGPSTHLALMLDIQTIGGRTQASMLATPLKD